MDGFSVILNKIDHSEQFDASMIYDFEKYGFECEDCKFQVNYLLNDDISIKNYESIVDPNLSMRGTTEDDEILIFSDTIRKNVKQNKAKYIKAKHAAVSNEAGHLIFDQLFKSAYYVEFMYTDPINSLPTKYTDHQLSEYFSDVTTLKYLLIQTNLQDEIKDFVVRLLTTDIEQYKFSQKNINYYIDIYCKERNIPKRPQTIDELQIFMKNFDDKMLTDFVDFLETEVFQIIKIINHSIIENKTK